jgi:hypothetical protein
MSGLSAKNLILDQKFYFWIVPSIYLDLCDHVKILQCLNRKWFIDEEELSWIISLCDLEQKHILSVLGRSSSIKDLIKKIKIISS